MNYIRGVRSGQSANHLLNQRKRFSQRKAAVMSYPPLERLSEKKLHGQERNVAMLRVSMVTQVVDSAHAGVIHSPCQQNFSLKPLDKFFRELMISEKSLHRDRFAGVQICCLVDFAHSTFRHKTDDPVPLRHEIVRSEHRLFTLGSSALENRL